MATYTEFYCQTTGNNLNAGSTTNDAAVYTSAAGDSDGTSVFTPNDGSTPASTVSVGMFGSVYVTAGATIAVFVGRVTVVAAGVNGAITFSTTAKAGTFPAASSGAHTITCKIGGAWAGPNATVSFPFGFMTAAPTDVAGDYPRVNFKSGTNYAVTAAMTHSIQASVTFEGYTTTPGDGGRATIDGTIVGASYVVLTLSGRGVSLKHLIFQNNGTTGSADMVDVTGNFNILDDVVFSASRGFGLNVTGSGIDVKNCEFFGNNTSNTASVGGLTCGNGVFTRCYFHNNSGANNCGAVSTNQSVFNDCIFDTNGKNGILATAGCVTVAGCDFYNNAGDAILTTLSSSQSHFMVENSNFVKNGGWAINQSGTASYVGVITNCGFGSGTQANTSGNINTIIGNVVVSGSITYASGVTPWNAPATGDFTITLPAAKKAGIGNFTETGNSKTGTVGTPDVGAAASAAAAATTTAKQIVMGGVIQGP